jgi:hypothetical protein
VRVARLLRHLTVTTVRRLVRRLVASGSDTSSRKTLQHVNAIRIYTSMSHYHPADLIVVPMPCSYPHCMSTFVQI